MAIKIPSKNIYEMENPKIRDNVIDNVSVEQTVVAPDNEYEVSVFNNNYLNENEILVSNQDNHSYGTRNHYITGSGSGYSVLAYYLGYDRKNTKTINIKVPILQKNKYISKVVTKDKDKNSKIGVSLHGKKHYGIATGQSWGLTPYGDTLTKGNIVYQRTSSDETPSTLSIPSSITKEFIGTYNDLSATITVDFTSNNNFDSINFSEIVEKGVEYFNANITFDTSVTTTELKADVKNTINNDGTITLTGSFTEYEVSDLDVTIYGNTVGISLTDGSITYIKDSSGNTVKGVGNKPHSLSRNELLQDSATTNSNLTTKELAENVLTQYETGKETATLLCDINEYYDYDNNALKISVKNNGLPMTFKIGDEVIPMVSNYTYGNKDDKPMSKHKDGITPKVFIICGIEKIYDGAVWQKLYIQEK